MDVDPATPLLWVLRDHLNLVGAKYGCGIAQCGACTIHRGDIAMRSCMLPVSQVGNQAVTTIEGLSENGDHPVQKAWLEHDVAQCGYCQSGQIMNAVALLKANLNPGDAEIEAAEYMEKSVAARLGMPLEKIDIQMTRQGRGFGQRLYGHFVVEATAISQRMNAPVKLVYTREDDKTFGTYRPAYHA